jgi:putative transposase
MAAALKFMKKLMKRHGTARKITTDGQRSYKAATKQLGNAHKQVVGRWANNRFENSHPPLRRRERAMARFRRMITIQKFASVHASVHNYGAAPRRFALVTNMPPRPTRRSRCCGSRPLG